MALCDKIKERSGEIGEIDLYEKIADESVTTDAAGLLIFLEKVGHPALRMPALI